MAKLKTVEPVVEQRTQPPAAIHKPTQAEIQERAYYLYVDRGRIDGFDREDWYLAETELRGGEQPAVREPDALNRVPELAAAAEVHASDVTTGLVSV
jgi:hypothetical protein